MAKDDFISGFLQGLFNSGVGNAAVNDERNLRKLGLEQKQSELDLKARADGFEPDSGSSSLQGAFQENEASSPKSSPNPTTSLNLNGVPQTQASTQDAGPHPVMKDNGFMSLLKNIIYPSSTAGLSLKTSFKATPGGFVDSEGNLFNEAGAGRTAIPMKDFREALVKKGQRPTYAVTQTDAQGNVIGTTPLPNGQRPAGITKPTPLRGSGIPGGDPALRREIVKAKASLAETRPLIASALAEIDRVLPLNDNSFGGMAGNSQMKLRSAANMGTDDPKFKNTSDVINTLQGLVSKVLKSTFGGQLSDGERQYLNEVYGAISSYSPQERKIAMTNIKTMLADKLSGAESKFNELTQYAGGDSGRPALSADDQAAIEWAQANPTDPRSAGILKLHGL